ncbi:MAG: GtrA family protein [Candidatus Daviesbacteria bacterium]|nr:GtrA family protein [Candidatus Daviesbacteria bacterium]
MVKIAVVVLPTFNEKDNLEKFVTEVLNEEKNIPGYKLEVLIVDSNSPDGTGEIAKKLASKNSRIHFLSVERGLGVGLIKGHQYSIASLHPDVCVQLDADGQVDVEVIPKLIKVIEDDYSLAIGSRFIEGGRNYLSPSRRFFSWGSSLFCKLVMGPANIREWSNSARAFTPELFKKINLDQVPWKESTFIVQPAFLNAAILAGARYKEVPLIFKNRAVGYSKMKTVNYIFDVVTYSVDARLKKLGIDIPFFALSRRAKTFLKFGVVGLLGTAVDFGFYNFFIIALDLRPATSKGFSTEIAIVHNFILNNAWTFRHRNTQKTLWHKFSIFNLVSLGGLLIGVLIIKLLHMVYGDGVLNFLGVSVPYYNVYFFATIAPVMIWNFIVNHLVTWRHVED